MQRKVKRIAIIAIVGFVATTLLITGCDNGNKPCSHTGGAVATCTTAQTCTKCGVVIQAALGHDHVSSLICKRTVCDHQYALGDQGPAGGIIIYRLETGFTMTDDDSTAYYLEAAPANMPEFLRWSTLTWGEYEASGYDNSLWIDIPGTGTAIGTGRKNTALILALDPTAPAALACKDYFTEEYESFNDWFLPSRDELNQLYLRRADLDLSSGWFWSSSQGTIFYAWGQSFDIGDQAGNYKDYDFNVRAVRAF
ncbi:MAG: DUF1566 domain-containing protein [Treponema sp.]|nr:DUF1566 domain-containing protein [Treponema sp.]